MTQVVKLIESRDLVDAGPGEVEVAAVPFPIERRARGDALHRPSRRGIAALGLIEPQLEGVEPGSGR
jgi:hypothetical protein